MVFTPTTLFKDTACPLGDACELLNCIFGHIKPFDAIAAEFESAITTTTPGHASLSSIWRSDGSASFEESPAKRRKITYEKDEDKPRSKADSIRTELAKIRGEGTQRKSETAAQVPETTSLLPSSTRPISPPPPTTIKHAAVQAQKKAASRLDELRQEKTESLNPRVLTSSPESHGKRTIIVQHIHSDLARLNRSLKTATKPIDGLQPGQLQAYVLDNDILIKLALSEEELIARDSPKVYQNLVRSRVAAYRKMTPDGWLKHLQSTVFPQEPTTTALESATLQATKSVLASLSSADLRAYCDRLVIKDTWPLKQHGYILEPPSMEAAEEQRQMSATTHNWEVCDRCTSRFRIFPDRDSATGLLTSGGPCRYHWGRKVYPPRQNTDNFTGNGSPTYRCCGQDAGAPGCTNTKEHVYKASSPARLAAVMPFITTPKNKQVRGTPQGKEVIGVVFDCEMVYTTNGLELARLTAINFGDMEPLLDLLVRPLGGIIDLNTRFSGIKAEMYKTTELYDTQKPTGALRLVPDPYTARELLLQYLSDDTPLMGHAIENDLNATRLCHPNLIDTILLYPHSKGLPIRYSLKVLTKEYLGKNIQMGGSDGHDSYEDAVATHDLIARRLVRDFGLLKGLL